jgi:hypothetical protein
MPKYTKVINEVCNHAADYFGLSDEQRGKLEVNLSTDLGRLDSAPVKKVTLGKLGKDGKLSNMRALNEAIKKVPLTRSLCVFKLVVGVDEMLPYGISTPIPLAKGLVEWLNEKPAPKEQNQPKEKTQERQAAELAALGV